MRVRASDVFVVGACAVVGYTYAGYPLLMRWAAARHARRPPVPRSWPSLSVVVPAFNETLHIKAKIANVVDQDYPAPVEVIVVADGSSDDTATLAGDIGAVVLWERERRGKSVAVNRGVAAARGDVVVLTDANCMAVPGAFRALARHFADPSVGVVSGAKTVAGHGAHGSGEGLYWRLESALKASESDVASTMGAPGELCAVRRASWRPIPPGIINDDYHITCDALIRGLRVTYDAAALTEEAVSDSIAEEWERRTRSGAGRWPASCSGAGRPSQVSPPVVSSANRSCSQSPSNSSSPTQPRCAARCGT